MKDWKTLYSNLPSEELDKIAVLRVMECTNGIIQYAHRDNASYKLSIEETRRAMKFSMSSIKNLQIPLKEETLTFAPETQELLREARDYYTKGMKRNDDEEGKSEHATDKVRTHRGTHLPLLPGQLAVEGFPGRYEHGNQNQGCNDVEVELSKHSSIEQEFSDED